MRYLLGSSFYEKGKGGVEFRREFVKEWTWNNMQADVKPTRIVVIVEGGSTYPLVSFKSNKVDTDLVELTGDLGYCGQLLSGEKKNEFSGWSASMLAGAMLAYCDEADFIYKEEDCLAFGPWVTEMYKALGHGDMVFGPKQHSAPFMSCSQSLFLVRHSFIPIFVSTYLSLGSDGIIGNLGEDKFCKIEDKFGQKQIRRLHFGVDRMRPIPWDAPVFYFQQPTEEELNEAKKRGLI